MHRTLYASAAIMTILISLLLLLGSCSPEGSVRQAGEDKQAGAVREDQTGGSQQESGQSSEDASQPQSLVPIVHITSNRESVSKDELSQNRELAVPQESRESAEELLGGSGFEGFDSAGAVVDYVSRNPEAMGLVSWDEVGPRVRALGVDGKSLLVPGAAPEDYALGPGSAPARS